MAHVNRPSILCVTSELPWPLDSGGHLRSYHLMRALGEAFDVRMIAGVLPGQERHVRALEETGIAVRPVLVDGRNPIAEGRRVVTALGSREPYVLFHRHNQPRMRSAIQREIRTQRPALCYFDHLDSCLFVPDIEAVPFVADFHNIYSLIIQREARDPNRPWIVRQYLAREAVLLDRTERKITGLAKAIFSVSEPERAHFAGFLGAPVYLVPNGVDCAKYAALPTGRQIVEPNILFVGTLSWPPNSAAVRFLAHAVLPKLRTRWPSARLTIVGRNPGRDVRALADGHTIVLAGNVLDIAPCLREASLLAVPLDSGGGTRLKILEAFAAGLPVVSTPVGCEGIAASSGRELLIADSHAFADAVSAILADPNGARELAARARALVREHYDWNAIGLIAVNAIRSLLDSEPATVARGDRAGS